MKYLVSFDDGNILRMRLPDDQVKLVKEKMTCFNLIEVTRTMFYLTKFKFFRKFVKGTLETASKTLLEA